MKPKIRRKFAQGEHGDVVNTARNLAARNQLSDIVTLLAGESATKLRNLDEAATFSTLEFKNAQTGILSLKVALAKVLQEKGELSKAEISFRNVLEQDSNNQACAFKTCVADDDHGEYPTQHLTCERCCN